MRIPTVDELAKAYINLHAPWYRGDPDAETLRVATQWAEKFRDELCNPRRDPMTRIREADTVVA